MMLYRACAFGASLAVVTALTMLISLPQGLAAPARAVLLKFAAPAAAPEAPQPTENPKPQLPSPRRIAMAQEATRTLTAPQPIAPERKPSETGTAVVEAPVRQGFNGDANAKSGDMAEGAGESAGKETTGGDSADSLAGNEGAPVDERKLAQLLSAYHSQIVQLIEGQKRYPQIARKLGRQGIVQLSFTLSQDGRLVSSQVSSKSGYPELDDAALKALRAVPKFPSFPTELGPANRPFKVSLSFKIK